MGGPDRSVASCARSPHLLKDLMQLALLDVVGQVAHVYDCRAAHAAALLEGRGRSVGGTRRRAHARPVRCVLGVLRTAVDTDMLTAARLECNQGAAQLVCPTPTLPHAHHSTHPHPTFERARSTSSEAGAGWLIRQPISGTSHTPCTKAQNTRIPTTGRAPHPPTGSGRAATWPLCLHWTSCSRRIHRYHHKQQPNMQPSHANTHAGSSSSSTGAQAAIVACAAAAVSSAATAVIMAYLLPRWRRGDGASPAARGLEQPSSPRQEQLVPAFGSHTATSNGLSHACARTAAILGDGSTGCLFSPINVKKRADPLDTRPRNT